MKLYNESNRFSRYLNRLLENEAEEKISDLLSFSERYLNLATLQRERMKSFENLSPIMQGRITNPEHLKAIRMYFGDIHFFFNCVHKYLLFTKRLIRNLEMHFPSDFEKLELHYRTIRNHFEHVDERIEKHPFYRNDFSSVLDKKIIINQIEYNFSDNALTPLYSIFDEVLKYIQGQFINPRQEWYDAVYGKRDNN